MRNNETGKMSETLIGEAVMELLETNDEISFDALVKALREASMRPENRAKAQAYTRAIADVRAWIAQAGSQKKTASGNWASREIKGWQISESSSGSGEKKH